MALSCTYVFQAIPLRAALSVDMYLIIQDEGINVWILRGIQYCVL